MTAILLVRRTDHNGVAPQTRPATHRRNGIHTCVCRRNNSVQHLSESPPCFSRPDPLCPLETMGTCRPAHIPFHRHRRNKSRHCAPPSRTCQLTLALCSALYCLLIIAAAYYHLVLVYLTLPVQPSNLTMKISVATVCAFVAVLVAVGAAVEAMPAGGSSMDRGMVPTQFPASLLSRGPFPERESRICSCDCPTASSWATGLSRRVLRGLTLLGPRRGSHP
jgi:hypothetical protein